MRKSRGRRNLAESTKKDEEGAGGGKEGRKRWFARYRRVQHTIFFEPLTRYKRCLLVVTSIQWRGSQWKRGGRGEKFLVEAKGRRKIACRTTVPLGFLDEGTWQWPERNDFSASDLWQDELLSSYIPHHPAFYSRSSAPSAFYSIGRTRSRNCW